VPRRFALVRQADPSGVSGTGVVAHGVQFDDGHVVVRWDSDSPSTSLWNSMADLLSVHGHEGATIVQWMDVGPVVIAPRRRTQTEGSPDEKSRRNAARHRPAGRHKAP
jgi:hypothetical protein